jgi:hypothetical protein
MFSVLESLYTHTGCVFVDGGVWCVYSNHGTHGKYFSLLERVKRAKQTPCCCTYSATKRKIKDFSDPEAELGYLKDRRTHRPSGRFPCPSVVKEW